METPRNPLYYRVAIGEYPCSGYNENKIRYLTSYIEYEPGETSWTKLKERGRKGPDEKTRSKNGGMLPQARERS